MRLELSNANAMILGLRNDRDNANARVNQATARAADFEAHNARLISERDQAVANSRAAMNRLSDMGMENRLLQGKIDTLHEVIEAFARR